MIARCLLMLLLLLALRAHGATPSGVVINEVLYHAPGEIQDLQFIELFNPADQPVELSGWKLDKGIDFQFPPGTKIGGGEYLVLARDADRFKEYYGFAPAGVFRGELSHRGTRIDLRD